MSQETSILEPSSADPSPLESIDFTATNDKYITEIKLETEKLHELNGKIRIGEEKFIQECEIQFDNQKFGKSNAKKCWEIIKIRKKEIAEAEDDYKALYSQVETLINKHDDECETCMLDIGLMCLEFQDTGIDGEFSMIEDRIYQALENIKTATGFVFELLNAVQRTKRRLKADFRGVNEVKINLNGRQDMIKEEYPV